MVLLDLLLLDFIDREINPNKKEKERIADIGSFMGKKPIHKDPTADDLLSGKYISRYFRW